MSYMHIDNLYKDQRILKFRQVWALEKIHGTSAHIHWAHGNELRFSSGGAQHERFIELFCLGALFDRFRGNFGEDKVVVYGEAYGGSVQKMSATYGKELRFVAFDVKVGDLWLAVLQAKAVTAKLGLEFVHHVLVNSDIQSLNDERDADSAQAERNGMGPGKMREGIVIRPPFEVTLNNRRRLIAKYKRDDFCEMKTPREVNPEAQKVLEGARAIADEWVTPRRLEHVLDKLPEATGMEHTPLVVRAVVEDVLREAKGEIVESKAAKKAISSVAARLWKKRVTSIPRDTE